MDKSPPGAADDHGEETLARYVDTFRRRYGSALVGVVLYGSWLRGQRDTMPDFYLLMEGRARPHSRLSDFACRALPPNVYQLALDDASGKRVHAKFAVLSLRQLGSCVATDFNPYFWARFAQPFRILWRRDGAVAEQLEQVGARAAERMIAETLPLMPARFDSHEFWQRALRHTFGAELRAETPERVNVLASSYADHFERALARFSRTDPQALRRDSNWVRADHAPSRWWAVRGRLQQWWSRCLSVLRLLKAAFTFNDPLDYILWKIERHSGVVAEPTALQRRHPLLFAWPLLWRVYRQGGFR